MSRPQGAPGRRIVQVQQAYSRIWKAFSDEASSQRLGADAADTRGASVSDRDGIAAAYALICLPGWPYKAVSNRRSVDIAVEVAETFSQEFAQVVHSTTRVGYFQRDAVTRNCRPILEIHYDYEQAPREAHPIFHVQLGTVDWPARLGTLGLGSVDRSSARNDYGNSRIPTAFMGFVPILVALAADHLSPKSFRQMLAAAELDDEGRVAPACATLTQKLRPAGIPHAHHWYDPRYVVYEWTEKGGRLHKASVPVSRDTVSGPNSSALRGQLLRKLGVGMADLDFRTGPPPP